MQSVPSETNPELATSNAKGSTFCLVVPVLNEAPSMAELLSDLDIVRRAGERVLVVDNGSTDGTWEALTSSGFDCLQCARPGYGAAVKAGLSSTSEPLVGWIPGNLKVSAQPALDMAQHLFGRQDATFAKARRGGRPLLDRATQAAAGTLLSLRAKENLRDFGGTPTVVGRQFVPVLMQGPDGWAFDAYVQWALARQGLSVSRPTVPFRDRRHGQSHWNSGMASKVRLMVSLWRQAGAFSQGP